MFQTRNSNVPDTPSITTDGSDNDDDEQSTASPKVPKIVFNMDKDRKYLERSKISDRLKNINLYYSLLFFFSCLVSIDIHQTRWHQNFAVQYIYGFPFMSEIIAIVWTAMCFIFQSGVKKQW